MLLQGYIDDIKKYLLYDSIFSSIRYGMILSNILKPFAYYKRDEYAQDDCSVCLADFNDDGNLKKYSTTICGHQTHSECIAAAEIMDHAHHPANILDCKCPKCRLSYDVIIEKWTYNKINKEKIPWYWRLLIFGGLK